VSEDIPAAPGSENPSQFEAQRVIRLYSEGHLKQAAAEIGQLLRRFPRSSFLHNIHGATQVGLGQIGVAIDCYQRALEIVPNDAQTHFNLAIAKGEDDDLEGAIDSYERALTFNPGLLGAYVNLGNALKDIGELMRAIDCYKQALKLEPDNAEVHNNLGNALKDAGELDQAVSSYRQALRIYPDYAEAYNNLGGVLKAQGDITQAVDSYERALRIKPEYADAAWNLAGTARSIVEAQSSLERCLRIDSEHTSAKMNLCVLEYFQGQRKSFDDLMSSPLKSHATVRSLKWVSTLPVMPELHFNRWSFFDSMMKLSIQERPFYEFGVFRGQAFKYLVGAFGRGFGFDTFEGLPEDWQEEKAGSYSSEGRIPKIAGGEFIAGKFEDTLPVFFSQPRPLASLINFDADLYSSTLCALNYSKPVIDGNTILIFDEFIVNESWEEDEFKAFTEFCAANNYDFEVLAVSFFTKQVAIRLSLV